MSMNIKVTRSRRKTLSVRITPTGDLDVRAPLGLPRREIEQFLEEKRGWIEKNRQQVLSQTKAGREHPLTREHLETLKELAREPIRESLQKYAPLLGVTYGNVTLRCQKSRWGSCSSKGNLNFNCLLALAPRSVLEYVVVHELAHRKQMNHSAAFWQEVARAKPDYKKDLQWLKDNGGILMARAAEGKE